MTADWTMRRFKPIFLYEIEPGPPKLQALTVSPGFAEGGLLCYEEITY
jgi:hypothetical protein